MKILKSICLNNKMTVIIIIHDLNLASLFCDELIILKNGEFIKKGKILYYLEDKKGKEVVNNARVE